MCDQVNICRVSVGYHNRHLRSATNAATTVNTLALATQISQFSKFSVFLKYQIKYENSNKLPLTPSARTLIIGSRLELLKHFSWHVLIFSCSGRCLLSTTLDGADVLFTSPCFIVSQYVFINIGHCFAFTKSVFVASNYQLPFLENGATKAELFGVL